ncbi:hypothetical protein CRE_07650 [Caenorhabditis remanei]|uniref:Uncharacterized protein n=1 Tax=Caenorhabditis remanei TaxID=31234 RepID=E3MP37_CAERE|nr:hypothetical protein CRE_07650 [Caenorhabditis remanei]
MYKQYTLCRDLKNRKQYNDSLMKNDNERLYKTVHDGVKRLEELAGMKKTTNFNCSVVPSYGFYGELQHCRRSRQRRRYRRRMFVPMTHHHFS